MKMFVSSCLLEVRKFCITIQWLEPNMYRAKKRINIDMNRQQIFVHEIAVERDGNGRSYHLSNITVNLCPLDACSTV
jgi:hypothetical protein